ncbi:MAG: hypothetical protein K2H75_03315 [Muribaculaceae bacterium]|nr:hypothetical protein [Muribaculaceae bacterium]
MTIGKLTGRVDNDSLLSIVRQFYTGNDPDHPVRDAMIADYYLGTEAMEKNCISAATRLLTAAKEAGEILRDTAYLCRIYGQLAILSQEDYNGPAFIDYSRKALEMALVADTANAVYDMMRLADAYSSVEKDSLTWEMLDCALDTYKAKSDKKIRQDILVLYGISKALNNEESSAIKMFEEALNLGPLDVNSRSAYAWALVAEGNVDKGLEQLRIATPMVQSSDDSLYHHHYAYRIYRSLKDYKQAMYHHELSHSVSNRFLMHRLDQPTYAGKEIYYRSVSDSLRSERQARIYREWLIGISAGSLLVIALLSVTVAVLRYRKRILMINYSLGELNRELTAAKEQISEMTMSQISFLEESNSNKLRVQQLEQTSKESLADLSALIRSSLDGLAQVDKHAQKDKLRHSYLTRALEQVRQCGQRMFRDGAASPVFHYLDTVYDNVFTHIREDYPKVSDKALNILALDLLGISYSSISLILDITYVNVSQYMFRLRKNLLVPDTPNYKQYKLIFK